MVDISDFIGDTNNLPFQSFCFCRFVTAVTVADNTVSYLIGKIESLTLFFNFVNNATALLIVLEAFRKNLIKSPFSRVTEGCVT